jgi:hypothetical protein
MEQDQLGAVDVFGEIIYSAGLSVNRIYSREKTENREFAGSGTTLA